MSKLLKSDCQFIMKQIGPVLEELSVYMSNGCPEEGWQDALVAKGKLHDLNKAIVSSFEHARGEYNEDRVNRHRKLLKEASATLRFLGGSADMVRDLEKLSYENMKVELV